MACQLASQGPLNTIDIESRVARFWFKMYYNALTIFKNTFATTLMDK